MKKPLLILSALAMASMPAFAGALEAGTAESPKYYTISASRGDYRYLAYDPNGIVLTTTIAATEEGGEPTQVKCDTHLVRNNAISSYCVWEVTQGSEEGTYVIKNLTADAYLMGFQTKAGEPSDVLGGVATTVDVRTEIFVVDQGDGTYMPSLNANGYYYDSDRGDFNYVGLDATGGNNTRYCGNYFSGDGVKWTFTEFSIDDYKEAAVSTLKAYVDNVPAEVAKILETAITNIMNLEYSVDFDAQAEAIRTKAIEDANVALGSAMNGTIYALKNLRRAANNVAAYLAVNTAENNYNSVATIADPNALFTFTSTGEGGYILYNEHTNTYINAAYAPVADEASAVKVYPVLNTNSGFSGVAFPFDSNKTGNGFNQNSVNGPLTTWSINDGGSIWALAEYDTESVVADAIQSVTSALEPYIPNVPADVAAILEAAIDEAKKLEYSASLSAEADAIRTKAIEDANVALGSAMNGTIYTLKNLRRVANDVAAYLAVNTANNNYGSVTDCDDLNALFTFTSTGEGGYILYNEYTKTYIDAAYAPVADEASAVKVYPVLNTNSGFAGVAFPFDSTKTGSGFNQNGGSGALTSWSINDGGSIWALAEYDTESAVANAIQIVTSALEPYIPNVPTEVAAILEAAIDEAKKLEYSITIASKAQEISSTAITSANDRLKTCLSNKLYSLKNLRQNKFVSVADGEWVYSLDNNVAETNYTFLPQTDGSYVLYNEAAKVYFGPVETEESGQTNVTVTTERDEAMAVYPFLCQGGAFSGVALALEANPTQATQALNTNNNAKILHTYRAGDAGSIFAIVDPDPTTGINGIIANGAAEVIFDLQGRRVNGSAKGLLIVNGKKTFRK